MAGHTAEEPLQRALGLAWRYLNQRERTVAEVRRRLEREELDEAAVTAAIEVLSRDGYLDDGRYARMFAEDKRTLDQWGSERIGRALRERGIAREVIDQALSPHGPASELPQALALLRRRFPSPPAERRERDRAIGMLLRKGYDSELALEALSTYAREGAQPGA